MFSGAVPKTARNRFSLKQRVRNAGIWSLAGYALSQVIRFGSNLLLTRLLMPEMFGVMAIAMTVMAGLALFSDIGLKQSIIQSNRGNDAIFLNTAWVTQIVRGGALWFIAVCVALLLLFANRWGLVPRGSAYADPSLPLVIAILAITAVISGFLSTKLYEAARDLSIGRVTQIEIAAQIAGLVCMLGWVYFDRSIWALIAGSICSTLVSAILSHTWLPGVANRWEWNGAEFREIIHFGKWIFVSSVLGFLVINGDRLLLGGLVDATVLGVYMIAYLIFSSVDQILSKIIAEVSFPALSEIARNQPARLKETLYRFHIIIAAFAYFCSGVLMFSGQAIIGLLYDRRYQEAGWILEILGVALLAVPSRTATQCFMALGMPRLLSNTIAFRLVTLFVFTPVGFHVYGVSGAVWGIVFSQLSYLPIIIFYSIKHNLFDARKEFLLLPVVGIGMIVGQLVAIGIGHY